MTAAFLHVCAVGDDLFEVLDGAVDEDALLVDARHRRHERGRAGRQHDDVVGESPGRVAERTTRLSRSISVARSPTNRRDAVLLVPVAASASGELLGLAMLEVFGEVDAIVGGPRLLAKGDDLEVAVGVELDKALAEAMADHAVADDHHRLLSLANHEGLRSMRAHRRGWSEWGAKEPAERRRSQVIVE